MKTKLKTVEEHKFYLDEIVKLSLWVSAKFCNEHPSSDIYNELDKRTPIFNHTEFNKFHIFDTEQPKPKEWHDIKERLKSIYSENSTPETFEKLGYELLKPHIYGRVDMDIEDLYDYAESEDDESWLRYEIHGDRVELHFENSLYPDSFMGDNYHFYSKLNECLLAVKSKGAKILYAGSWLNSYNKFLDLLPPQWKSSRRNRKNEIEFHLGFWGQFLRSNESFNEINGAYLRENGKVKYPEVHCEMTVEELENFLLTKSNYITLK